ncbi:30S ribosomal protein S9 [Candidatus Dojkabacteria bacterium]|nr:30S ribosomal protein S9 [Candidatus Dojkabacteria bacterium]
MKYTYAKGRRKTSVATIRLYPAKGESMINDKKVDEVYSNGVDKAEIFEPLKITETLDDHHFTAKTQGGGKKSQIGAIRHGLARALVKENNEHKAVLKSAGLLTRDDRMKERKKTGLRKARKGRQFSKR